MKNIKHSVFIGMAGLCCFLCGCATSGVLDKAKRQPQYIVFLPLAVPGDVLTFPLQYEIAKSLSGIN
jgi:hypothetical protein